MTGLSSKPTRAIPAAAARLAAPVFGVFGLLTVAAVFAAAIAHGVDGGRGLAGVVQGACTGAGVAAALYAMIVAASAFLLRAAPPPAPRVVFLVFGADYGLVAAPGVAYVAAAAAAGGAGRAELALALATAAALVAALAVGQRSQVAHRVCLCALIAFVFAVTCVSYAVPFAYQDAFMYSFYVNFVVLLALTTAVRIQSIINDAPPPAAYEMLWDGAAEPESLWAPTPSDVVTRL